MNRINSVNNTGNAGPVNTTQTNSTMRMQFQMRDRMMQQQQKERLLQQQQKQSLVVPVNATAGADQLCMFNKRKMKNISFPNDNNFNNNFA